MGEVKKFEDLVAWQKAQVLAREIYRVTGERAFAGDFGLKDQMRRAGVSVMSNIAEGYERLSPGEFHQFLVIAKASCAELKSQLFVAFDVGYLDRAQFTDLTSLADEAGRIIGGLRVSVARRREHGK